MPLGEAGLPKRNSRSLRSRRWLVEYARAVPVAIFLLIAAITALSVYAIERGENRRDEARMNEIAQSVASSLERRGNTASAYLRAGAALFGAIDAVEADLFRRFVSELRLDADYREADGIGWAESIAPAQIPEFEQRLGDELPGETKVYPRPGPGRQTVVPVTFLQPDTERNRRALGFDMYSEPARRAAMDEALRSVRPTASGAAVLIQEGGNSAPGFLIYMPVFEGGISSRRLRGFIHSPFNGQDFLESALEIGISESVGIQLFDGDMRTQQLLAELPPAQRTGNTLQVPITVANRAMLLVIESSRGNALSPLSMITLLFGLLVASLLMVVARLLTQQALEDQESLDWLEEQNSIRNSLTRELNHRVKNTLANVLSIVSLTRRRASNLDGFAEALDGRIRALSATHDLLTQSEWGATPIRAVIEAELAPYVLHNDAALELAGPNVELAPNDALSLGLAVHELATNAAKYGSLSVPAGKVRITWSLIDDKLASIRWLESKGPPVPGDRRRGFGSELIEKIVAHELRHPVDLKFNPEGVSCTLLVPVRQPSEFELRARARAQTLGSR